jgi:hypothetical protein
MRILDHPHSRMMTIEGLWRALTFRAGNSNQASARVKFSSSQSARKYLT